MLSYFDPAVTEAAIASCDETNDCSPLVYTNLRRLYKLLMSELEGIQGPATEAQKNLLVEVRMNGRISRMEYSVDSFEQT